MKEIKVELHRHENDDYNELYKVIEGDTTEEYFVRHTSCGGEWCFVSDPLGYCELDHSCPDDYIFIVCDYDGNELFKDSNGEISHPFPTRKKKAKMVWEEIKKDYPTVDGLHNWLKSFITKEVKERLKKEFCIYENWTTFWYDEINKEVIKKFEHLGVKYCIYKVVMKHQHCECEWIDYFAGAEIMDEYDGYIKHFGSWFDNSVIGECYGNYEAVEKVANALKSIYPNRYKISRIEEIFGIAYERKMDFRQAAEYLVKGNYERAFIDSIIAEEKNNKRFYTSYTDIKKDYPGFRPDYS